jgi:signal transduction histidine kinase
VSISVSRSDDTVIASVSDTGRGLPSELTVDFARDAPPTDGSTLPATGGAGLALSSRLARSMNGRVTACNKPDSGAMVSLWLPAADDFPGEQGTTRGFASPPWGRQEDDRKKPRQTAGL